MERDNAFSLDEQVNNWAEILQAKPSLTDSDVEEIKSHFYDSYESILRDGVNEKEAFLLAKRRMGESFELDEAYEQANQPVLQMRRSLYILAGVIVYFLLYHFILASLSLFIYILMKSGVEDHRAVEWSLRYLVTWHFIVLLFLSGVYFFEKRVIVFLEKTKLTPKQTIITLALTVLIAIINTSLLPVVRAILRYDLPLLSKFLDYYVYFDYSFPFLMGLGFIFIYFRYYKKAKI